MKIVILDTNSYGLLAKDVNRFKIVEKIKTNSKLIVYGFKIIRNELRDTPKSLRVQKKGLRIDLLNLYDGIVEEHILEFNSNVQQMAGSYYKAYREFGGIKPREEILNDFSIVSAATIYNLDIIISNDDKTMLNESALRAYKLINSVIDKRTPKFISYEDFKRLLRGDLNELV